MRRQSIAILALAALASAAVPALADHEGRKSFRAFLHGYEEVPAINTPASGRFEARLANDGQSIEYTLSYEDLRGTVTQAHIHFAARGTNGGVMLWLCGTSTNPGPAAPNNPPTCPTPGGTVNGTLTAASVQAIAAQQLSAGDLQSAVDAMRVGAAYVNVHTTVVPSGEIRGQVR
jgi:hypothetical protein